MARWARIGGWLMPALCALLLAAPSVALPERALGIRRFQTPPVGPDLRVGQTFVMTGNGLHAIEVAPAGPAAATGDVRFELYELSDREAIPIRVGEVPAADLLRESTYRFEFAPIAESRDRIYRLDLVAAPAQVAFWATRGDGYAGGSLHANGRERWADLAFRAYAPAPSVWSRLMTLRATNPARAYAAAASLLAAWVLLGAIVRGLARTPPEPDHTGSPHGA